MTLHHPITFWVIYRVAVQALTFCAVSLPLPLPSLVSHLISSCMCAVTEKVNFDFEKLPLTHLPSVSLQLDSFLTYSNHPVLYYFSINLYPLIYLVREVNSF